MRVKKDYAYLPNMLEAILAKYAFSEVSIRQKTVRAPDDPDLLALTIASVPPVSKATLVADHIS